MVTSEQHNIYISPETAYPGSTRHRHDVVTMSADDMNVVMISSKNLPFQTSWSSLWLWILN